MAISKCVSDITYLLPSPFYHRDHHSLPTRRSSDLVLRVLGFVLDRAQHLLVQRERRNPQVLQLGRAPESRSEEHTSELQSPCNLVFRLLLVKYKHHMYVVCTQCGSIPSIILNTEDY